MCRLLLDLMGAPPSTSACATDEIPLHAELRWTTQGALVFDVTSITRRRPTCRCRIWPRRPRRRRSPRSRSRPRRARRCSPKGELAAFRTGPVEVPPARRRATRRRRLRTPGCVLVNASDELRVAWLDGVPVAWVAPGARVAAAVAPARPVHAAVAHVPGRRVGRPGAGRRPRRERARARSRRRSSLSPSGPASPPACTRA